MRQRAASAPTSQPSSLNTRSELEVKLPFFIDGGTCGGARDESRAPETIEYEGHFVVAAEIFKVRNAVAEAWVLLWLT